MSWSTSIPKATAADFPAAADASAAAYQQATDLSPEAYEQLAQAVAAAKALIASGAVGTGNVTAMLGGHANAGHLPCDGWASDCISVTVACTDTAADLAAAADATDVAATADTTTPDAVPAPAEVDTTTTPDAVPAPAEATTGDAPVDPEPAPAS